jgi:hypothetical protein
VGGDALVAAGAAADRLDLDVERPQQLGQAAADGPEAHQQHPLSAQQHGAATQRALGPAALLLLVQQRRRQLPPGGQHQRQRVLGARFGVHRRAGGERDPPRLQGAAQAVLVEGGVPRRRQVQPAQGRRPRRGGQQLGALVRVGLPEGDLHRFARQQRVGDAGQVAGGGLAGPDQAVAGGAGFQARARLALQREVAPEDQRARRHPGMMAQPANPAEVSAQVSGTGSG